MSLTIETLVFFSHNISQRFFALYNLVTYVFYIKHHCKLDFSCLSYLFFLIIKKYFIHVKFNRVGNIYYNNILLITINRLAYSYLKFTLTCTILHLVKY